MATKAQMSPAVFRQFSQMKAVEPDRSPAPLIGHIITDEDAGTLQGKKLAPINLRKVAKLLSDPHAVTLLDRHLHALDKITKHYQQGFLMKDLVVVYKILNICADHVEEHAMYVEPMCAIIRLCSMPFLKEKTSDEMTFKQIAVESVSQLGYLMRVPSSAVRQEICRALIAFYRKVPNDQVVQKLQGSRLEYNRQIVNESDVAETLVKSMTLLEHDLTVKLAVLDLLQQLSKASERNCEAMLQAGAGEKLCQGMLDPDPSGLLLFRSVECLWNLLENTPDKQLASQLATVGNISQLRDAFIQQLTQGYSHYDRQLRNDLLVIASLVASVNHDPPFVETGFVRQLTVLATFQEVKSHHALVRHLKLMTNAEDFELKKLLVNILVVLSQDSAVIPLFSDGRLLLALFTYVKANEKTADVRQWSPAQFEELQLLAMDALCTLGPLLIEDYMTCQGSTRLLLLLEWCVGSDDFGGAGNSFHGVGGRGNKRAQMRHCIRLIHSMVSTGSDAVLQDFMDQGAITQLTGILKTMCHSDTDDAVNIEMQCDMLVILSLLCDGDMHRKELFGNEGVDVCTEYLRKDASKLSSGLGHHRLMLAAVDCIWCSVIGCYITEDYFMEKEGVFLLIDLLDTCPKTIHNLVLGSLLDLCENPKTVAHINVWHGSGNVSAAHLFCSLWRTVEDDLHVARTATGAIANWEAPLMGSLQKQLGVFSLPASCPSQAIVDVSENMRSKIYALFGKIGFIELPGLTTDDHITLTIIEHYLDFKLGEVWSEMISELEQEGVRPVTPDSEALKGITRALSEHAQHVVELQCDLLDAQNQQDLIDEQEHYAEIREIHRQKEKALRDFNDYIVRTSNYSLLQLAHEKQELSIDASRVQPNYKFSPSLDGTCRYTAPRRNYREGCSPSTTH